MTHGFFITFEGTDGVGKTTHAQKLSEFLRRQKKRVVLTREPGGGEVADKIRSILLNPRHHLEDLTELFLYQSARIEHLHKRVIPALQQGKIVLCDRFTDATMAYQGYARGLSRSLVRQLNQIATGGLKPHLTLLLDYPPKKGLQKAKKRTKNKAGDRMENQGLDFQNKVRRGYLALARQEPKRIKKIRVQPTIEQTQRLIQQIVDRSLA